MDYFIYEGALARAERNAKRWLIAFAVTFCTLVGTNLAWVIYENSFEDTWTLTQETPDGNNNYIGHDGDITNGTPNDN